MLSSEIKEKIEQNAISLEDYEIGDLAWFKNDAESLILSLAEDKIGILGGDVYKLTPGRLEPLCDNWYCERNRAESEEEFYSRSKVEALQYIRRYPISVDNQIIFGIVFTEQIAL